MHRGYAACAWITLILPVPLILALARAVFTQQVSTGYPPFGSFSVGQFDTVNNANLNVHFAVPVVNKAGRGLPFYYRMSYDSSVWTPTPANGQEVWMPTTNWGWTGITDASTGYISYTSETFTCLQGTVHEPWFKLIDWQYHDPSGTSHPFTVVYYSERCGTPAQGGTGIATDGSGYRLTVAAGPSATVISRSGETLITPQNNTYGSATVTDSNGNELTATDSGSTTTFTDTLGTTALR